MQDSLSVRSSYANKLTFICLALLGCGLMTVCSLIKVPFYPVPFTLQTFAIFFLVLTQSPKQAFASAICYLFCGTIGLPVFCSHANQYWMFGKCGGYLVAFPIAAYLTSKLAEQWPQVVAILFGQSVVYLLGFIWLIPFFGESVAFTQGVVFFIPSDLLKILMAISLASCWNKWRNSWVQ